MKRKSYLKLRRRWFSLVEMIVAMAIFAIFALISVQFFSGTKNAWLSSEHKVSLAADANIAMDVMSNMLRGILTHEEAPFLIMRSSKLMDTRLLFLTNSPTHVSRNSNSNTYWTMFWVDPYFDTFENGVANSVISNNNLVINVVGDHNLAFGERIDIFDPEVSTIEDYTSYFMREPVSEDFANQIVDGKTRTVKWAYTADLRADSVDIIPCVVGIDFVPLEVDEYGLSPIADDEYQRVDYNDEEMGAATVEVYYTTQRPDAVRIEMTLMTEADYAYYQELVRRNSPKAASVFNERKQSFSRTVYLGNRDF